MLDHLGVCYTTRDAAKRYIVSEATLHKSFTVVTMHDDTSWVFDPLFVSTELFGSIGLVMALADDWTDPHAAIAEFGIAVSPGEWGYEVTLVKKVGY